MGGDIIWVYRGLRHASGTECFEPRSQAYSFTLPFQTWLFFHEWWDLSVDVFVIRALRFWDVDWGP